MISTNDKYYLWINTNSESLDLYSPALVNGSTQLYSKWNGTPRWYVGDKFTIYLALGSFNDTNDEWTPRIPSAGDTVKLTGMTAPGGTALFYSESFSIENDDLNGTTWANGFFIYGEVDLNTTELISAIGSESTLEVTVEVEITASDTSWTRTIQFTVDIYNELISGALALPAGGPLYYTESEIDAKIELGIVLTIDGGQMVITVDGIERGRI